MGALVFLDFRFGGSSAFLPKEYAGNLRLVILMSCVGEEASCAH